MALYDRSHDPMPTGRRSIHSTSVGVLLAAVAAMVLVLAIYAVSHAVGPEDQSSIAQASTPSR
jgi:hypothetical protein